MCVSNGGERGGGQHEVWATTMSREPGVRGQVCRPTLGRCVIHQRTYVTHKPQATPTPHPHFQHYALFLPRRCVTNVF